MSRDLGLKGKRITVMGLGLHGGGLGVAQFLLAHGARVTVTDLKSEAELRPSVEALAGQPVTLVLGRHRDEDFAEADMVVRNPGVPGQSRFLQIAREHGVPVEMEMGLFFRLCPAPIIGVTGTKGKSTTASLVAEIMRRAGRRTVLAGNLRVSALGMLPRIDAETAVVLELSSWQLEGLETSRLSPHGAVVTNVYPDHLNRYRDMAEYSESKKTIFRYQQPGDYVVLNWDNPYTRAYAADAPRQVIWVSTSEEPPAPCAWLNGDDCVWSGVDGDITLCRADSVGLPGRHGLENALAALAVGCREGLPLGAMQAGVAAFTGLPDRQEFVAEAGGVRYINDTNATTPDAAVAALHSIGGGIVLLAGGSDKRLDFQGMAREVLARAKAVAFLKGEGTVHLQDALEQAGAESGAPAAPPTRLFDNLRDAMVWAVAQAASGDAVLLSPGCASFGMFPNETERGRAFKSLVAELVAKGGDR